MSLTSTPATRGHARSVVVTSINDAITVAAHINDQAFSVADLRRLFEAIEDKSNWKNPIRASIPAGNFNFRMFDEAVAWFHGSRLREIGPDPEEPGFVIVEGPGYAG